MSALMRVPDVRECDVGRITTKPQRIKQGQWMREQRHRDDEPEAKHHGHLDAIPRVPRRHRRPVEGGGADMTHAAPHLIAGADFCVWRRSSTVEKCVMYVSRRSVRAGLTSEMTLMRLE